MRANVTSKSNLLGVLHNNLYITHYLM